MFKSKKNFTDFVLEKVKEGKIVDSERSPWKLVSIEDVTSAAETVGKYCCENHLPYGIHLGYIGFRDGNGKTDKKVRSVSFMPAPSQIENGFIKEMKTIENILGFFNNINDSILPHFFQEFGKNISIDIAKTIELENLSEMNEDVLKIASDYLFDRMKEWEFGYYQDLSFGVGKTFYVVFCEKEIVKKNLITICKFMQEYCKKILKEQKHYRFLYGADSKMVLKLCPQILTDGKLTADFIANTKYRFVSDILETASLNKDIILEALKQNPKCYNYLPEEYQMDIEICIEVLNLDFEMIHFVMIYGPINSDDWKQFCISYLKGENNE